MSVNGKNGNPIVTPADRAALESLARREDRAGIRARIVLKVADGSSHAGAARAVFATEKTVRAALRRFAEGGVECVARLRRRAGKAAAFPELKVSPPPELSRLRDGGARGPCPRARRKIETWVRDCAALGLVSPGGRLPDRAWFQRRFRAAPGVVQAAFDALSAQGFVRSVPREGSFLADPPPFAGRYLLGILPKRDDQSREGLDASLLAAARRQEKRLGVRWEVADIVSPSHPDYLPTFAKIASQRYAGVMLRASVRQKDDPGRHRWFASVDHVPVCSCSVEGDLALALGDYGSHFSFLGRQERSALEMLFASVRAAGCGRALVLGVESPADVSAANEAAARAAAAKAGVTIPPHFYQCSSLLAPLQTRRLVDLLLASAEAAGIDAAVCLQDNFAPILCDAVIAHFRGAKKAASRIRVFSMGSFPNELSCPLPVEWHGDDWDATLDDFVRWCDAIHAGVTSPPPPAIVRR